MKLFNVRVSITTYDELPVCAETEEEAMRIINHMGSSAFSSEFQSMFDEGAVVAAVSAKHLTSAAQCGTWGGQDYCWQASNDEIEIVAALYDIQFPISLPEEEETPENVEANELAWDEWWKKMEAARARFKRERAKGKLK